jgi:hypothetical protein
MMHCCIILIYRFFQYFSFSNLFFPFPIPYNSLRQTRPLIQSCSLTICVCVCVCIYIYLCIYIHTYLCMYTYINMYLCMYTYINTYLCMHKYVFMYVYIYLWLNKTPLHICTTFFLIHSSVMRHLVYSQRWLLWIVLQ